MRITRTTNIFVKTERKFVVRQQSAEQVIYCGECAEPMTPAQMSADLFGVSSRAIYRLIETERIHFTETEANEIYVCPSSIKQVLELIRVAG